MATVVVLVCSRCGNAVRPCSPRCTMGGWVHAWSERHLCNPAMAWALRDDWRRWERPWLFAAVRRVEVSR